MKEMEEMQVQSLGWEDPPEKDTATHSSTLDWRIPWTEEPGGLPSIGSQRVRCDWSDLAHICTHTLISIHTKHSLVVQRLGLCSVTAGSWAQSLVGELGSYKPCSITKRQIKHTYTASVFTSPNLIDPKKKGKIWLIQGDKMDKEGRGESSTMINIKIHLFTYTWPALEPQHLWDCSFHHVLSFSLLSLAILSP